MKLFSSLYHAVLVTMKRKAGDTTFEQNSNGRLVKKKVFDCVNQQSQSILLKYQGWAKIEPRQLDCGANVLATRLSAGCHITPSFCSLTPAE